MTRVLVVQRDRDVAQQYAAWLERQGFQVVICGGPWPPTYYCPLLATGACSLCASADVFVYDPWLYVRPDGSGSADLIRELRRTYPDQPVILTWGHDGMPGEVARQQMDPWVRPAPSDPPGLVRAVREVLAELRRSRRDRRPHRKSGSPPIRSLRPAAG